MFGEYVQNDGAVRQLGEECPLYFKRAHFTTREGTRPFLVPKFKQLLF